MMSMAKTELSVSKTTMAATSSVVENLIIICDPCGMFDRNTNYLSEPVSGGLGRGFAEGWPPDSVREGVRVDDFAGG